jgi:hypothetical protein
VVRFIALFEFVGSKGCRVGFGKLGVVRLWVCRGTLTCVQQATTSDEPPSIVQD